MKNFLWYKLQSFYYIQIIPKYRAFKYKRYEKNLSKQKAILEKRVEKENVEIIEWYKNSFFGYNEILSKTSPVILKLLKHYMTSRSESQHFVTQNLEIAKSMQVPELITLIQQHELYNFPWAVEIAVNEKTGKYYLFNAKLNSQDYDILVASVLNIFITELPKYNLDSIVNYILDKIYKESLDLDLLNEFILLDIEIKAKELCHELQNVLSEFYASKYSGYNERYKRFQELQSVEKLSPKDSIHLSWLEFSSSIDPKYVEIKDTELQKRLKIIIQEFKFIG